jgi:hypothetical protein
LMPAHPNGWVKFGGQTRCFLTLSPKFMLNRTGSNLMLDWSL